jgi:hypothetical protein
VGYTWLPGLLAILTDLEPYEVMQGLQRRWRRPRPMHDQFGNRYLAIHTRTDAGRPIVVTIRLTGGFDATIIGARPMTPAESVHLEQWEQDHE